MLRTERRSSRYQFCSTVILEKIELYIRTATSKKHINLRENRRGNQEWTIQKNWQHWVHKTIQRNWQHLGTQDEDNQNKKHNTISVVHHYTKTNTNSVSKT